MTTWCMGNPRNILNYNIDNKFLFLYSSTEMYYVLSRDIQRIIGGKI